MASAPPTAKPAIAAMRLSRMHNSFKPVMGVRARCSASMCGFLPELPPGPRSFDWRRGKGRALVLGPEFPPRLFLAGKEFAVWKGFFEDAGRIVAKLRHAEPVVTPDHEDERVLVGRRFRIVRQRGLRTIGCRDVRAAIVVIASDMHFVCRERIGEI